VLSMPFIGEIARTARDLGKRMECKSDKYEHETSERAARDSGADC
jgi:hypothetical protein